VSPARSRLTTIAVLLSVLIVAAAAQCRPAAGPTVQEYRSKSPTLQRADQSRVLRIGVTEDYPLMSIYDRDSTDKESNRWSGFDVSIARMLAGELGFAQPENVEFVPITTDKRVLALQEGSVHLVVADFTMTDERRKTIRFAGPYLLTTPEVMIRKADVQNIRNIDDLKKVKVCTTGGSTTADMLEREHINHTKLARGAECAEGVEQNIYDAHCTDEVVIAGFIQRSPDKFAKVDMPFTQTEPLGIGIPLDDPYLEALVAHILRKQLALGQRSEWQAAYTANLLGPLGKKSQPQLLPGYPVLLDQENSRG
jgi:glutamate transport system substrate-binding protein